MQILCKYIFYIIENIRNFRFFFEYYYISLSAY